MESYARVWLTEAGFYGAPQVLVRPRGHRDLLVEGCVVVELDGWETHGNKEAFREDRGWIDSRFTMARSRCAYTFADLFGRDRVDLVADVEAALQTAAQRFLSLALNVHSVGRRLALSRD